MIDDLPSVSLAKIGNTAGLQTRRDRKYVVSPEFVDRLISELWPEVLALEIDGQRDFGYESLYFDTPDLVSYLAAAHRRRRRFKVRHRHYVDAGTAMLEVKVRTGRGRNAKLRLPVDNAGANLFSTAGRVFVDGAVGAGTAERLVPILITRYRRSTLVDLDGPSRLTIDRVVTCTDRDGSTASVDGIVLETKTVGPPSQFDRWLWAQGHRPIQLSKYCPGLAALRPTLPANKWHRPLRQHLS